MQILFLWCMYWLKYWSKYLVICNISSKTSYIIDISSQVLCKWVPIYLICSRILLLKFFANWCLCIFFQDLCETTSCRSNSWTNEICSKLHKSSQVWSSIKNSSFQNSIANQPNLFKSIKFEALAWNQSCLESFMEVLE